MQAPWRTACIAAFFNSILPTGLHAGESTERPWKNTSEISLVSTNGNSNSATTAAKNRFQYKWTKTTLQLEAAGLGTKSESKVTAERYSAGEKVYWKLTGKNYLFEEIEWNKDRFAGIQNRYKLSTGLGRDLLTFEKDKLIVEIGVGYVNEERIGSARNTFASGRTYTKYTHHFIQGANFSQDAELLTDLGDTQDYRLNIESSLTATVTTNFSVKLSYLWERVNRPPDQFGKNDTTTGVSLIANF